MKRETPSDREIAELIAPALECLPAPDARRLTTIEKRLLAEIQSRGRSKFAWWWLAAALVAGAASALWWAVDYDSGKEREEPVPAVTSPSVAPPLVDQPVRPDRSAGAESAPAGKPARKQGPVIYQRER
jgi:hypothetical protein